MQKITTDNKWKYFNFRYEVPDTVLKDQFSHLTDEDTDGYFKYRNYWYHTSDFIPTIVQGWNWIHTDSFFSGVLLKISKDSERYQVGTITC